MSIIKYSLVILFSLFIISPVLVLAQVGDEPAGDKPAGIENQNNTSKSTVSLPNPLGITSVPVLIGRIIKGALGIVGSLALLMFVYGGFVWMLSGGNSEKVQTGRKTLVWAAIGLAVIFTSFILVDKIISTLGV
ncbi:MAG: pilin [Patescibacteria group bacterium]|nr:MAG: pilin [Patescibacteria group bacterium]